MGCVTWLSVGFLLSTSALGNTIIESDHVTNWGSYGNALAYCPRGSYANAFELKNQEKQGGKDDTSLNAIRLSCATPDNPNTLTGKVVGNEGGLGSWGATFACPRDFITAFQLRQEKGQGAGDDTAANNLRTFCGDYAGKVEGDGNSWGDWGSIKRCPAGQFVCGINAQVEPELEKGDSTGLNNVQMECCEVVRVETTTQARIAE